MSIYFGNQISHVRFGFLAVFKFYTSDETLIAGLHTCMRETLMCSVYWVDLMLKYSVYWMDLNEGRNRYRSNAGNNCFFYYLLCCRCGAASKFSSTNNFYYLVCDCSTTERTHCSIILKFFKLLLTICAWFSRKNNWLLATLIACWRMEPLAAISCPLRLLSLASQAYKGVYVLPEFANGNSITAPLRRPPLTAEPILRSQQSQTCTCTCKCALYLFFMHKYWRFLCTLLLALLLCCIVKHTPRAVKSNAQYVLLVSTADFTANVV